VIHVTCSECGVGLSAAEVLEHLRLAHPDDYGSGLETWPDGRPVVHDMTLEPTDFIVDGGSA
jgi:hypothetical protein